MNDIQEGDHVQLKDSGPVMTVDFVDMGSALCSWYDEKGTLHQKTIDVNALVKVEE